MSVIETVFSAFEHDPEGAAFLVDEAVSSYMAEQAEVYDAPVQAVLAKAVATRTAVAKRQLARSYVECLVDEHAYPDESVHKTAQWLAGIDAYTAEVLRQTAADDEISKALFGRGKRRETWNIGGQTVVRQVIRDERGRFTGVVDTSVSATVPSADRISPHLVKTGVVNREGDAHVWSAQYDGDEPDKARGRAAAEAHQGQWEQANKYAQELSRAWTSTRDNIHLAVTVQHKKGAEVVRVPLESVRGGKLLEIPGGFNPLDDKIHSVRVETDDPNRAMDVARFNAMGGIGDTALARMSGVPEATWTDAIGRYDANTPGLDAFFRRMRGASTVLGAAGQEKSAKFAQLVGVMGPQAETVMGPHVRQAAYRYRGTEKTPDANVRRGYGGKEMRTVRAIASAENPLDKDGRPTTNAIAITEQLASSGRPGQGVQQNVVTGSAAYRAATGADRDQLKLQVNSDVGVAALVNTLPTDPMTAELSEASGHVLPSQGILLDYKGRVVSQSVGYADDHYLPFDLRNMAALHGGQYIRTRVAGGLTGEDIYASVQSGARMATVVSSSGVYSIEFDPNFRGARGNSDKARSMYTRYLKILDAVEKSGLYSKDIPGPRKTELKSMARTLAGSDASPEQIADQEKRLLEEERRKMGSLTAKELEDIQSEAERDAKVQLASSKYSAEQLARLTEDLYNEKADLASEQKVARLRLNAKGYEVALRTLKQQFPYFIRDVSYEPLKTKAGHTGFFEMRSLGNARGVRERTSASDTGYVAPGGLRPQSVRSGYYNVAGPDYVKGTPPKKDASTGHTGAPPRATKETAPASGGDGAPPAAGTAPAAGAGSAPAAPGSRNAAQDRLTKLSGAADKIKQDAVKKLDEALIALAGASGVDTGSQDLLEKPWADVRSMDANYQAQWLLLQRPSEMLRLMESDPDAADVVQNDSAMRFAFNKVYSGYQDAISTDGRNADTPQVDPKNVGGATTVDEASRYVLGLIREVGEAAALTKPFSEVPFDQNSNADVLTKPRNFPTITANDTQEKLAAYLQSPEGAHIGEVLEQIGATRGGEYATPAQFRTTVKKWTEALSKVHATLDAMHKDALKTGDMSSFTMDKLEANLGLTGQGDSSDLGLLLGINIEPDALLNNPGVISRRLEDLQKAWTLYMTERVVQMADSGLNGEPGAMRPKGPEEYLLRDKDGFLDPSRFAKAAPSSRQVRFAKADDPLARLVARRRALGLPLV
jgi:hypothetical protein